MVSSGEMGYSANPSILNEGSPLPFDSKESERIFVFSAITLDSLINSLEAILIANWMAVLLAKNERRNELERQVIWNWVQCAVEAE